MDIYRLKESEIPDAQPADGHDTGMSIAAALEELDRKEVRAFIARHGQVSKNEAKILWARAQEIGGRHPYLCDLELAYNELKSQDPSFGELPAEEPEPEVVQKVDTDDRGIIHVGSDGGTRILVVDPAVRAELNKLPIRELARRAAADRHANLSDRRKLQIKTSEI